MKSTEQLIGELKVLLEIANNSKEGYQNIAKNTSTPEFKILFTKYARERVCYVTELEDKIRSLGGDADNQTDNLISAFNQSWIDLKDVLNKRENRIILETIIKNEHAAVEEYDKVLKNEPYSSELYDLLSEQRFGIQKALNIISEFSVEYQFQYSSPDLRGYKNN